MSNFSYYWKPLGYTRIEGGHWLPWYFNTTVSIRELELFMQLRKKDREGLYTFKHKVSKIHSLLLPSSTRYFRWDVLNGFTSAGVPIKTITLLTHALDIHNAIWFGSTYR